MQEKKIVRSLTDLQESTFKIKKYLKDMPREITSSQKREILIEITRFLSVERKAYAECLNLVKLLEPDLIPSEYLRDLDRNIGAADLMMGILNNKEIMGDNDKEND